MNFSPLLSSIIKGQWAIDPRMIESNRLIIEKMLNRGFTSEAGQLLSEAKPFMWSIPESDVDEEDDQSSGMSQDLDMLPPESTLIIPFAGTMLKYGSWCTYGTTEVAKALLEAGMHKNIGSIVWDLDSGGGTPDSIAPLSQAIQLLKSKGKSVVACVDLCASAAYYAASFCDEIIANNDISAEIGSIGVMCSFKDYAKYYETEGITEHVIYSNLSEYKNRPFELAKKGEYDEIKVEELDPMAKRFQATIRANRGNKLAEETPGLLAGRMFYADQAKEVGLIDHIGTQSLAIQRAREIRKKNIVNQYFHI